MNLKFVIAQQYGTLSFFYDLFRMAVVDVRSEKEIGEFEMTLHTGPITIVLVYADWCGHCQNYKKDVWSNIVDWRKEQAENGIPMNQLASVHYDQLPNTSQKNVNLDGYPSVLVVGNDKKAATFPEGKNALPSHTARDLDALKEMLKIVPVTVPFSAKASKLRNKVKRSNVTGLSPPNSGNDITRRQGKTKKMKRAEGKTLLQSLMQSIKQSGGKSKVRTFKRKSRK